MSNINLNGCEYKDFTPTKTVSNIHCLECGLEITHGIKNNEFCSKPCFYLHHANKRERQPDTFRGFRYGFEREVEANLRNI